MTRLSTCVQPGTLWLPKKQGKLFLTLVENLIVPGLCGLEPDMEHEVATRWGKGGGLHPQMLFAS